MKKKNGVLVILLGIAALSYVFYLSFPRYKWKQEAVETFREPVYVKLLFYGEDVLNMEGGGRRPYKEFKIIGADAIQELWKAMDFFNRKPIEAQFTSERIEKEIIAILSYPLNGGTENEIDEYPIVVYMDGSSYWGMAPGYDCYDTPKLKEVALELIDRYKNNDEYELVNEGYFNLVNPKETPANQTDARYPGDGEMPEGPNEK